MPNATITLRNTATGQTLVTQTTDAGSYTYPNVPVGDYILTIECAGFAPATQELKVALNQESSANVTIQVGGVVGQVEVTAANEALVQIESSQLGRSFGTRQVQDLPIFGDQKQLALLSPNVVQQAAGTAGEGGTVGGVRSRYNNFNVDGIDNNDPSITGEQIPLIQDAIQEFTLLTNNFNAEFGTAGGGQFNTITRSGTNDFHGSGFLYVQNQHLNAASTAEERQLRAPTPTLRELPRYRDARYGATLGGPVMRNKLFFFGAVQHAHN
ncbi:MAG: carboxypeptidase regulatory-like domain-containing protein, partial [Pyrinomonadaceae bacterium]|nr:carboxypeptidase regulatory-like domain-containing protein [Pyrinomonadaceae bacterium]